MLDLLMSTGWAQDATATTAASGGWSVMLFSYLPIIFIFAIFYFLIIRPQNTAAKAHADLVKALKKGDMVLIDGGLIGEVKQVNDQLLHLKVNHEDMVCVARASVKKVLSADESKGWMPQTETFDVKRKK